MGYRRPLDIGLSRAQITHKGLSLFRYIIQCLDDIFYNIEVPCTSPSTDPTETIFIIDLRERRFRGEYGADDRILFMYPSTRAEISHFN